jgi:hypothetical protein
VPATTPGVGQPVAGGQQRGAVALVGRVDVEGQLDLDRCQRRASSSRRKEWTRRPYEPPAVLERAERPRHEATDVNRPPVTSVTGHDGRCTGGRTGSHVRPRVGTSEPASRRRCRR